MKYESTRGLEKGLDFHDVLFAGYSKDGGLYMPETIPKVSPEEAHEWRNLEYKDLVFAVLRKFISRHEITDHQLQEVLSTSFNRFVLPSVIGSKRLPCDVTIFELFHGPTLAFKDLALFVLSALLDFFMKKKEKKLTALVGTSGDTGSSALESVRGRDNIDIIVLLPKERCTVIQRLQMTTISDKNTHVYCVEGTSDDLDVPIKQCFLDKELTSCHDLISMNSINMGRILAQIPIYIYAYYRLTSDSGQEVEIIVPTGAAGSITAGCIAHEMGFPLRLIPAVNINQVVARTLTEGIFRTTDEVHRTFSSAMDIQMPYNLERMFYLFSNNDGKTVNLMMNSLENDGKIQIPKELLAAMNVVITGTHVVADKETTDVIKKVKEDFNYFICPHTATAVSYFFSLKDEKKNIPRGILATASPEKFPEAVEAAGYKCPEHRIKDLFSKQENFIIMKKGEDWFKILKNKIISLN